MGCKELLVSKVIFLLYLIYRKDKEKLTLFLALDKVKRN
jgi:hypothetical protein